MFDAQSMFIATVRRATRLIAFPYEIDEGKRSRPSRSRSAPGSTSIVIRTRAPLRLGTRRGRRALGAITSGTSLRDSWLGVPILGGDGSSASSAWRTSKPTRTTSPTSGSSSTLASSMGVALENARLFDETKRLLAETDQRAAELAVINERPAALAKQLDFAGHHRAGRRRVRRSSTRRSSSSRIYDADDRRTSVPVRHRQGERFPTSRSRSARASLDRHRTGRPLRLDDIEERRPTAPIRVAGEPARPSWLGAAHRRRRGPRRHLAREPRRATPSARPTSGCSPPSRRAWAWRSRTPGCSTRRSGC